MRDIILVTGGTGTTGGRVSAQLSERGLRYRVATRTPSAADQIRFDWTVETTWPAALEDIKSIYLVAPSGVAEPLPVMTPFMELAIRSGVKRFVLLSASSLEAGGPMMGAVHAWLRDHAPEWVVLRPTWFMQNFSDGQHLATIRDEGAIYTATDEGRIGFIDAEDIAAVAVEALTKPECVSGDIILTGPAALSYDAVAQTLSDALKHPVKHHHLSVDELAARHMDQSGLPEPYARTLAQIDAAIAAGSEDRVTDAVPRMAGRPAHALEEFIAANSGVWSKR
ncbi:ergot alkaloid biosynthesis protein [Rhodophyticola sp. CCM32]|uniref:NAD(P)H-binding protein n=1 Tax=Rhodophyticola sp. CCM32 TaxID=2916397 RepID=UPI00107FB0D1|nr:NAD(P)H-binding protein [Rhodophyticola sp. CCM32]QBY00420.1 ergot alkaloid biosynthesis protein [Rhodophyticola sp. CCM32]